MGEGFEDLVGALVPDKRFGIVVLVGDPGAISRYALGDCSGLTYNDDGSLTLYIQRDRPDAPSDTNWLPAPSEGDFKVAFRLYSPKPEVALGKRRPPRIERAD